MRRECRLRARRECRRNDAPPLNAGQIFRRSFSLPDSSLSGEDNDHRGRSAAWDEAADGPKNKPAAEGDPGRAVAILDETLATCDRTGYRAFEAELLRVRGDILLKRDPASFAPAEEAFRAAIAVVKQQATRSFELRAALGLAKLCRSTNRPVEAHVVLALGDFSPTPEFPEIEEALALLAALEAGAHL